MWDSISVMCVVADSDFKMRLRSDCPKYFSFGQRDWFLTRSTSHSVGPCRTKRRGFDSYRAWQASQNQLEQMKIEFKLQKTVFKKERATLNQIIEIVCCEPSWDTQTVITYPASTRIPSCISGKSNFKGQLRLILEQLLGQLYNLLACKITKLGWESNLRLPRQCWNRYTVGSMRCKRKLPLSRFDLMTSSTAAWHPTT